jgi:formate dehydrogenase subunit delta
VNPSIRLANDVAAHFHHRPPAEGAAEVADHLRTFWDPRMRAELLAHAENGAGDLDPLAVAAAALLRSPAA